MNAEMTGQMLTSEMNIDEFIRKELRKLGAPPAMIAALAKSASADVREKFLSKMFLGFGEYTLSRVLHARKTVQKALNDDTLLRGALLDLREVLDEIAKRATSMAACEERDAEALALKRLLAEFLVLSESQEGLRCPFRLLVSAYDALGCRSLVELRTLLLEHARE